MAATHRLTFDVLCEEAFGIGLHPWEFYRYTLKEYLLKRTGYYKEQRFMYQRQITTELLPWMKEPDRKKVLDSAFNEKSKESPKQLHERLQKKYAGIADAPAKRKKDGGK